MQFTFGKDLKLKSQKKIGLLHSEGKSLFSFPFAIKYSIEPDRDKGPLQIMVSAPKRNFKRAHDRNRIKRLMRESLRINKQILNSNNLNGNTLYLSLTYRHNEILDYKTMEMRTQTALKKLLTALEKSNEQV